MNRRGAALGALVPGAGIAAGAATDSPAGGLAAAAVLLVLVRGWRSHRRTRDAARRRDAVVDLLTGLALELRGGRPPALALHAAAALPGPRDRSWAASLGPVLLAAGRGADVTPVLVRSPEPGLRALGAAWAVTARTGAPLAGVVEALATGLRADRTAARERAAALAGPRASAALLALLPAAGIPLAAGIGTHPVGFLLHHPAGQGCLLAGVGLDLLALGWTRRLTDPG